MHAVQLKTLLAPWLLPPFSLLLVALTSRFAIREMIGLAWLRIRTVFEPLRRPDR